MSVKVVIAGCCGRMGSRIAAVALNGNDPPITIAGAFEVTGHPAVGKDLGSTLNAGNTGVIVTMLISVAYTIALRTSIEASRITRAVETPVSSRRCWRSLRTMFSMSMIEIGRAHV